METKVIDLYSYFGIARKGCEQGYLTLYLHKHSVEISPKRLRPGMLVIGGGAYLCVSDREKEAVCLKYLAEGFNAFSLDYSCAPTTYPCQLLEGCMAIAYIRENAEKLHIRKDKVCAIGFSAGGHLTGMLATMTGEKVVKEVLKKSAKLCRPDAVILSYAVITSKEFTHEVSMQSLCGNDKTVREYVSVEDRVDKHSSPAFIWCTQDDKAVPCENSLLLMTAYRKAGVLFEGHIFMHGVHGSSLCTQETTPKQYPFLINEQEAQWFNLSLAWLSSLGFNIKD